MPTQNAPASDAALAGRITRSASQQTYYTIRFLADRQLVEDAYRAYAYFRWVDDWLDKPGRPDPERLVFLQRQQNLVSANGNSAQVVGALAPALSPEEHLAVDLLQREQDPHSGLHAYFNNLMAVMEFDAGRRQRPITGHELSRYTHSLAVAVTEAMHHFIGKNCRSPQSATRYLAVSGSHITHMLRDTFDDVPAGYYNIPQEVLVAAGIGPNDVHHPAYREWVHKRVDLARACFKAGRSYLAKVESLRCRVAAFAYMLRFEGVLDSIEKDGYLLRQSYTEQKNLGIPLISRALRTALQARQAAT